MAKTDVYVLVKNATWSSGKMLSESELLTLRNLIYDALDGVTNLTYGIVQYQTRRDDDTAGS